MARIDGYPVAAALAGTDALPVMQGGFTRTATMQQVGAYVGGVRLQGVWLDDYVQVADASKSDALARIIATTTSDVRILLNAGTYTFNTATSFPGGRSIEIVGAGLGLTRVYFAGAGTWLTCAMTALDQRVTVSGFRAYTSSGTGSAALLSVSYPVAASSAYACVKVSDVDIISQGSTAATTWTKGLVLNNCWSSRIVNVTMIGRYSIPGVTGTCLLDLSQCFDAYVDSCVMFYGDALVYQSDYSEGIRLSRCSAIGTNYLVRQAAAGVTTRAGYSALGVWVNACEANTQQGGVGFTSVKDGLFAGNQWTQWAGVAPSTAYAGYDLTDCQSFACSSDVFVGGNPPSSFTGVKLRWLATSCSANTWNGSVFEGSVGVPVDFGSGTVQNAVLNARKEPGSTVLDAGTANRIVWRTATGSEATKGPRVFAGSTDQSLLSIADVASAVNIIQVLAGAAGNSPNLVMGGSDTNIGLTLTTKGQAGYVFNHGGGTAALITPGTATTVNYPVLNASNTGAAVNFTVAGTDANIPIALTPKGTGALIVSSAGAGLGFYGAAGIPKPTVTGAKGGNVALTNLMNTLATLGILTDTTS